MKELQRHLDAFEIYFKHKQEGRNTKEAITLVSMELKFSETSLYKWKKEFDWDGREAIRSREIQRKIEEKTNNTIIENKIKYLSFYHKLLDDLRRDWNLKIDNVRDLEVVTKNALLLQDEPTEHVKEKTQTTLKIDHNLRLKRLKRIEAKHDYRQSSEGSGGNKPDTRNKASD